MRAYAPGSADTWPAVRKAHNPLGLLVVLPVQPLVYQIAAAVAHQCLARRTNAGGDIAEVEVARAESLLAGELARLRWRLVVKHIVLRFEAVLMGKALVALAHLPFGNQRGNDACLQLLDIVLGVVARISKHQRVLLTVGSSLLDHRQQHAVLSHRTDNISGNDDLVLAIDGGLCGIALDHALASGHLSALRIGDIGLDLLGLAV